MKTTTMLVILALVLGLVGSASADLVAHYEFEGNANDSSGFGFHGIPANGATIFFDTDRHNVLKLDGVGDYVDCGNVPLFDITSSITLACWVKVDVSDNASEPIVTKGNHSWRLQRTMRSHSVEFACTGLDVVGTSSGTIPGITDVIDSQWHHVAGVYDGNNIYLYVDGVLDNSRAATGTINTNTLPVLIGGNAELPERGWAGMIDDVRIYNNALSAPEIAQLAGTDGEDYLKPIAYAFIDSDARVISGTPNVSCTFNSFFWRYEITISDEHYWFSNYVTVVTLSGPAFGMTARTPVVMESS